MLQVETGGSLPPGCEGAPTFARARPALGDPADTYTVQPAPAQGQRDGGSFRPLLTLAENGLPPVNQESVRHAAAYAAQFAEVAIPRWTVPESGAGPGTWAASTSLSLHDNEFFSHLAERLRLQASDGLDQIRILLKPALLGKLEVRAETGPSGVVATITAESSGVKDHLEQNLHLLHRSLQDQGVKVDRIIVVENSPAQQSSMNPDQGSSGAGQEGRPSPRHPALRSSEGSRLDESLPGNPLAVTPLSPNSTFHAVA
ncbi:MAG: flagellar hook-length control protein FliK [Acidobacteriota bacterium]